jgi:hypothetical protein
MVTLVTESSNKSTQFDQYKVLTANNVQDPMANATVAVESWNETLDILFYFKIAGIILSVTGVCANGATLCALLTVGQVTDSANRLINFQPI